MEKENKFKKGDIVQIVDFPIENNLYHHVINKYGIIQNLHDVECDYEVSVFNPECKYGISVFENELKLVSKQEKQLIELLYR